jgi:anti-anti-sigma factor
MRSPVQWLDQAAVVLMPAEIDIANAGEVRDRLLCVLNKSPAMLIVDMSATSFCDSGGINALVRAHQRALADQTTMRVVVTTPVVRRVLTITGVDRLFGIYPTVAAALAASVAAADAQADPGPADGQQAASLRAVLHPDAAQREGEVRAAELPAPD